MVHGEVQIEVPKDLPVKQLESRLNGLWQESELFDIAKKHGADLSGISLEDKESLERSKITVTPVGGGFDPATIALLISLAPLIKTLTPLLEPIVKSATTVAEKVALDLWQHIKTKMWQDDHIALSEKKL